MTAPTLTNIFAISFLLLLCSLDETLLFLKMDNGPSEVVFTTTSSPIESGVVFRYGQGSVKVPAPRKRGRPIGCKQLVLYTRTTKLDADLFNQQLREEKLEMMWMSRNGKIMKDFNLSIWVVIRPTSIVIPGNILERG